MRSVFVPNLHVDSFSDIDSQKLLDSGVRGIIFDLDNTLISWGKYEVTDELFEKMATLKKSGFRICIVSNNSGAKIKEFANRLEVPIIQKARKPSRRPFYRAMKLMSTNPDETVMVGDQIFTDIVGGNRSGLFTILVLPVSKIEFVGTRVTRFFEKIVLKHLRERGYMDHSNQQ